MPGTSREGARLRAQVESRVAVAPREAVLQPDDLPAEALSLRVQVGEQALFEPGQAEPDNWDGPDLVSG
jgi:hypothetical protein